MLRDKNIVKKIVMTREELDELLNELQTSRAIRGQILMLIEILGVITTAISYWLSGERNISPVSARIIRLFKKYPSL